MLNVHIKLFCKMACSGYIMILILTIFCTECLLHNVFVLSGMNVFIVTNFVGKWIWPIGNWFCLLDIRFVDDWPIFRWNIYMLSFYNLFIRAEAMTKLRLIIYLRYILEYIQTVNCVAIRTLYKHTILNYCGIYTLVMPSGPIKEVMP